MNIITITMLIGKWRLIVAVALFIGGMSLSWWWRGVLDDADKVESLQRAIDQAQAQAEIDNEIYKDHVDVIHDVEIRYREIESQAEGVRTPDCVRLGDDWFGMFNSAINSTYTTSPVPVHGRPGLPSDGQ